MLIKIDEKELDVVAMRSGTREMMIKIDKRQFLMENGFMSSMGFTNRSGYMSVGKLKKAATYIMRCENDAERRGHEEKKNALCTS